MNERFILESEKQNSIEIDKEYLECIHDLIEHDMVAEMKNYIQHGDTSCLQHCLHVSYHCFKVCRRLGLDYRSAARGGLLHDFFLYDWHGDKPYKGLHGFKHAKVAHDNACRYFDLNDKEKDMIKKHMWPLNLALPKYLETAVIVAVDKYCAALEIMDIGKNDIREKIEKFISAKIEGELLIEENL